MQLPRPLRPPGATRNSPHRDPHPSRGSRRTAQQLRAQLSDTPGQHLLPRCACSSSRHLCPCFGTKSLRELAPPDSRLLLISHRRTRTESPPALPCSQLSQSPTVPKPQGGHTKPNKASPCPRPPQEPDVHLSPPQGNASSGERIDGGARSSHQLPREEPWLPSPPASCSNHLFCFYFRKRWGSALRRSQPPSQPPHRRARRQISAKR